MAVSEPSGIVVMECVDTTTALCVHSLCGTIFFSGFVLAVLPPPGPVPVAVLVPVPLLVFGAVSRDCVGLLARLLAGSGADDVDAVSATVKLPSAGAAHLGDVTI